MTFVAKVLAGPVLQFPKGGDKFQHDPKKKYKMSKTYEVWNEEALDAGDTDDRGFDYKDQTFDNMYELAEEIRNNGGNEASSSQSNPNNYYSTTSGDTDIRTGETTHNAFHPRLKTMEEAKELDRLLKLDQNAFNKEKSAFEG